jgi:hypothetical protein
VIPDDIDGNAEGDPEDELCDAVSPDDQADHGRCHGEREEVGRQERNVDVLGEPEENGNGAQERFSGPGVGFAKRIAMIQQDISSYHILLPGSYVASRDPGQAHLEPV